MYTLGELAALIKAEPVGDLRAVVRRARPFPFSEEGDVTLALDSSYRSRITESRATAVIVAPPVVEAAGHNLLITETPKLAFARAVQALHARPHAPKGMNSDLVVGAGTRLGADLSIHARVTIGSESVIGDRVTLHPGVVIGDRCRVGDDTVLYANVSVYDDCEIGARAVIHAGTVIGSDGFGFVPDEEGRQVKLLQLGRVRIEDDCEIGANCAIDRGGFGDTILRRGVKLDNFIQVGHNTEIGEDTVVAAMTGFSGGTRVGRRCVIAGQVGTVEHITIGDRAIVTARTVVTKNVRQGAMMSGMIPARDHNAWRRSQVLYSKLPELAERVKRLEELVRRSNSGG